MILSVSAKESRFTDLPVLPINKTLSIGDMVRYLRLQRGWTQHELARKSYLSIHTIQKIENFRTKPNQKSLTELSRVFRINLMGVTNDQ